MRDAWTDNVSDWWNDTETGPSEITIPGRLTYPNGKRAYYQAGDLLFGVKLKRFQLEGYYLEYKRTKESDFSWAAFLMLVLGVTGDGNVVDRIVSITGTDDKGYVVTKPLLKLSNTDFLELTRTNGSQEKHQSFSEFKNSFVFSYYAKTTSAIIPFAEGMVEVVSVFFGGGAKNIFGSLFKRFGKRKVIGAIFKLGGQRIVRVIMSKMSLNVARFIARTSKDVLKKYLAANDIELIKRQVDKNPKVALNTNLILKESIRDAVADNLIGEIVGGIESIFPDGTGRNAIPIDVREKIVLFVTKHLHVVMLTPITDFLRAAIQSIDFAGDKHTYGSRLAKRFEADMKSKFNSKTPLEAIERALKELIAKPELVF
jgi:hypothetical protein